MLLSVRTPSVRPVSWPDTPRLCVVTRGSALGRAAPRNTPCLNTVHSCLWILSLEWGVLEHGVLSPHPAEALADVPWEKHSAGSLTPAGDCFC